MFASIVHGVVVKVLTKYFDGIDESEINVRLWKGEIELFHLKLAKQVVNGLGLPIQVDDSSIEKVRVVIPWNSFGGQQDGIQILVENVVLKVKPVEENSYSKMEQLNRLHSRKCLRLDAAVLVGQSYEDGGFFSSGVVAKLIDHIQIQVKNVKVVYSDVVNGDGFELCTSIGNMHLQSTNAKWQVDGKMDNTDGMIYKMVMIENVTVDYVTKGEEMNVMMPVHANVKLTLNGGRDFDKPQVKLDVLVLQVHSCFTVSQLVNLYASVEKLSVYMNTLAQTDDRNLMYGDVYDEMKSVQLGDHIRNEHWKRAIKHIVFANRFNKHWRSWKTCTSLLNKQNEYTQLLQMPEKQQDEKRKMELELQLPFEALVFARKKRSAKPKEDKKQGWGSWMYSFYDNNEHVPSTIDTEKERELLHQLVESEKEFRKWKPPSSYVVLQLQAELGNAIVDIIGNPYVGSGMASEATKLLTVQWNGNLNLKLRPNAWVFDIQMKTLEMIGVESNQHEFNLLSAVTSNSQGSFANISVEMNPENTTSTTLKVNAEVRPADLTVRPSWVQNIIKCIAFTQYEHISKKGVMKGFVVRNCNYMLKDLINNDQTWSDMPVLDISIQAKAPVMIIEYAVKIANNEPAVHLLVIDLGTFVLSTEHSLDHADSRYNQFQLDLKDVAISLILQDQGRAWRELCKTKKSSVFYIVQHVTITMKLDQRVSHADKINEHPFQFLHLENAVEFPVCQKLILSNGDRNCPDWIMYISYSEIHLSLCPAAIFSFVHLLDRAEQILEIVNEFADEFDDYQHLPNAKNNAALDETMFFDCTDESVASPQIVSTNESMEVRSTTSIAVFIHDGNMKVTLSASHSKSLNDHVPFIDAKLENLKSSIMIDCSGYFADVQIHKVEVLKSSNANPPMIMSCGDSTANFINARFRREVDHLDGNCDLAQAIEVQMGVIIGQWYPAVATVSSNLLRYIVLTIAEMQRNPLDYSTLWDAENTSDAIAKSPIPGTMVLCVKGAIIRLNLEGSRGENILVAQMDYAALQCITGAQHLPPNFARTLDVAFSPQHSDVANEELKRWVANYHYPSDVASVVRGTIQHVSVQGRDTSKAIFKHNSAGRFLEAEYTETSAVGKASSLTITVNQMVAMVWIPAIIEIANYLVSGALEVLAAFSDMLASQQAACSNSASSITTDKYFGQLSQTLRNDWVAIEISICSAVLQFPVSNKCSSYLQMELPELVIYNAIRTLSGDWRTKDKDVPRENLYLGTTHPIPRNLEDSPFLLWSCNLDRMKISVQLPEEQVVISDSLSFSVIHQLPLAALTNADQHRSLISLPLEAQDWTGCEQDDYEGLPLCHTFISAGAVQLSVDDKLLTFVRQLWNENLHPGIDYIEEFQCQSSRKHAPEFVSSSVKIEVAEINFELMDFLKLSTLNPTFNIKRWNFESDQHKFYCDELFSLKMTQWSMLDVPKNSKLISVTPQVEDGSATEMHTFQFDFQTRRRVDDQLDSELRQQEMETLHSINLVCNQMDFHLPSDIFVKALVEKLLNNEVENVSDASNTTIEKGDFDLFGSPGSKPATHGSTIQGNDLNKDLFGTILLVKQRYHFDFQAVSNRLICSYQSERASGELILGLSGRLRLLLNSMTGAMPIAGDFTSRSINHSAQIEIQHIFAELLARDSKNLFGCATRKLVSMPQFGGNGNWRFSGTEYLTNECPQLEGEQKLEIHMLNNIDVNISTESFEHLQGLSSQIILILALLPKNSTPSTNVAPSPSICSTLETSLEFNKENTRIGLELRPGLYDTSVFVQGFQNKDSGEKGWAELTGKIHIGDQITSVNDTTLLGITYDDAIELLQTASRPTVLTFRQRAMEKSKNEGCSSNEVVEHMYENQRYFGMFGFSTRLLPTDRKPWTDAAGYGYSSLANRALPTTDSIHFWRWVSPWKLQVNENTDDKGWMYAFDFPEFDDNRNDNGCSNKKGIQHFVRRRRWTRKRTCNEIENATEADTLFGNQSTNISRLDFSLVARLSSYHITFTLYNGIELFPLLHLAMSTYDVDCMNASGCIIAKSGDGPYALSYPAAMSLSSSISCSYFNINTAVWEPLLEPASGKIMVSCSNPAKNTSSSSEKIRVGAVTSPLNINISMPLLELFSSTWKSYIEDQSRVSSSENKIGNAIQNGRLSVHENAFSLPLVFENFTGVSLEYWFKNDVEKTIVQSGVRHQLNAPKSRYENRSEFINIHILGGWANLVNLPVDKLGLYSYCLRPAALEADGPNKMSTETRAKLYQSAPKISWNITLKDGIKTITLQSSITVSNKTMDDLTLSIKTRDGAISTIGPILPGNVQAIPVHAVYGKLSVDKFHFSRGKSLDLRNTAAMATNDIANRKLSGMVPDNSLMHLQQQLTSLSSDEDDSTSHSLIRRVQYSPIRSCYVQDENYDASSARRRRIGPHWQQCQLLIEFISPVKIVNELNVRMDFEVACKAGQPDERNYSNVRNVGAFTKKKLGSIAALDSYCLHDFNFETQLFIRVRSFGADWSQWLSIAATTKAPKDTSTDELSTIVPLASTSSNLNYGYLLFRNKSAGASSAQLMHETSKVTGGTSNSMCAARCIHVTCDYFLKDETGLSLLLGQRAKSIVNGVEVGQKTMKPISGQTVPTVALLLQNERWTPLGWGEPSLPGDLNTWTYPDGTTSLRPDEIKLDDGWTWSHEWMVDRRMFNTEQRSREKDGWWYATDFQSKFHIEQRATDFVRHRVFCRGMLPPASEKVGDCISFYTLPDKSHQSGQSHGTIAVRIGDGTWSNSAKINRTSMIAASFLVPLRWHNAQNILCAGVVDIVAGNHAMSAPQAGMRFSSAVNEVENARRTITFKPKFMLRNKTKRTLYLRQVGCKDECRIGCNADSILVWSSSTLSPYISISWNQTLYSNSGAVLSDWHFSGPCPVNRLGTIPIRIHHIKDDTEYSVVVVRVLPGDIGNFVVEFANEDSWSSAFAIHNKLNLPLEYRQKQQSTVVSKFSCLKPKQRALFGWDSAVKSDEFHVFFQVAGCLTPAFSFEKITTYPAISLANGTTIYVSIIVDGLTRVMVLTDSGNATLKNHQAEAKQQQSSMYVVSLDIPQAMISIFDHSPRELFNITFGDNKLALAIQGTRKQLSSSIGVIRIDNMLKHAKHCALFWHSASGNEATSDANFVFDAIACDKGFSRVSFFEQVNIQILPKLHVAVDDYLLFQTSMLAGHLSELFAFGTLKDNKNSSPQILWFEVFVVHPIKVILSFDRMSIDTLVTKSEKAHMGIYNMLLDSTGMAVANIREASISAKAFVMPNSMLSLNELSARLQAFYHRQIVREIASIAGSSQLLGNPSEFLYQIGEGVQGFVAAPTSSNNIAVGLAKGATSLVGNTLLGFSNSAHGITSSLSKGISSLTSDSSRGEDDRKKSRNVFARTTAMPVGAVAGVAIGALNFASKATEAISKTTNTSLKTMGVASKGRYGASSYGSLTHLRRHRAIYGSEKSIRAFDEEAAIAMSTLTSIENGSFRQDCFEGYVRIDTTCSVIVSNRRLLYIVDEGIKSKATCKWFVLWEELLEAEYLKGSGSTCGIYVHSLQSSEKIIRCPNFEIASAILDQVNYYVELYGEYEI